MADTKHTTEHASQAASSLGAGSGPTSFTSLTSLTSLTSPDDPRKPYEAPRLLKKRSVARATLFTAVGPSMTMLTGPG